jgi:type VI protein secretion system component Hcp
MGETMKFDILLDGINGPEADKSIVCLEFGFGTSYNDLMLKEYFNNNGMNTSYEEDIIPFTFVHRLDKATPAIQRSCQGGRVLKKASFRYSAIRGGGSTAVLTVVMEQVQITGAKVKAVAANPGKPEMVRAVEEVELVYEKINWVEGAESEHFHPLKFPAVFAGGYGGGGR